MTIGDIEKLQRALEIWDETANRKQRFIDTVTNYGEDEPSCGYSEFDSTIFDFDSELAADGDNLAAAVRALARTGL